MTLLTSAIAVSDELQLTSVVLTSVLPSEKTAVAIKGVVVPFATVELAGVTVIAVRVPPLRHLMRPNEAT